MQGGRGILVFPQIDLGAEAGWQHAEDDGPHVVRGLPVVVG